MTKYLVVGAGLFGATFAYEAAKRGNEVHVIENATTLPGIFIRKKFTEFRFINMVRIFFILPTKKFGTMSINLLNSTAIRTVRLLITMAKFTTCRLT